MNRENTVQSSSVSNTHDLDGDKPVRMTIGTCGEARMVNAMARETQRESLLQVLSSVIMVGGRELPCGCCA